MNYQLFFKKNMRMMSVSIFVAIMVIGTVVLGQRWYSASRDAQAQNALSSALELYEKALRTPGITQENNIWNDVEAVFHAGFEKHKHSSLAPYFLIFQSEVSRARQNLAQSLDYMTRAVSMMSYKEPLYFVYATKLALMQIDATDESVRAQGIAALDRLAQDKHNYDRDEALYYQGYKAWVGGNIAEAERVWTQLLREFGTQSAWAQLAQAKITYQA